MGRQAQIKSNDIGALLRLIHELHEMQPNPVLRHEHLLQRLCAIVDAAAGGSAVFDLSGSEPALQFVVYTHATGNAHEHNADFPRRFDPPDAMILRLLKKVDAHSGNALVCNDSQLLSPRTVSRSRGHAGRTPSLFSALALSGSGLVTVIYLARDVAKRIPFHPDQCQIVALLHSELAWMYERDERRVPPQLANLTPRQRETLDCLLAGHSEKQIALELGRSPHTVHIYVKAIYRAFNVNTRAELLARFVGWSRKYT
jgi:DNA-binding CsgD family transcriptional regulator